MSYCCRTNLGLFFGDLNSKVAIFEVVAKITNNIDVIIDIAPDPRSFLIVHSRLKCITGL